LTSVKVDQAIEYVKDTLSQLKAGDFSSLPESLHLLGSVK
jgi:hypothetical protein